MLNKLLKYDLKWNYKLLYIFYILSLIFAIISRIFSSIDNSLLSSVIGDICGGCSVAMIVNCLINTVMRSWVRFIRNIYKDESYLTHTLPVKKNSIYLAKILSSIITSFTTILVIIFCFFICYYSKENMEILKVMLELASNTYNTTVVKLLLTVSVLIFIEIVFILLIGYVGIIIGHKSNKNKMMKSIIWGFGLYVVTQIITIISIFIFGLFDNNIMNVINTIDVIQIDTLKILILFAIILYSIYNIIYYFIGKWQFNKGINID